jgi:hypothetical protein
MRAGDEHARRSVVPKQLQASAGRSLWPAAVWTGLGAAIVCATLAIVAVAACWLPVSGTTGRTNSAIRAGLLTFLAAVHGGITVDGVATTWLPLGLTVIVAITAWRAGSGLADAAEHAEQDDPRALVLAGLAQAASFTVGCLVAVPFATLGTSSVPALGVGIGAAVLFAVTGGTAFVRSSALRNWLRDHVPTGATLTVRAGAAVALVYLASGALVAAGSLVLHHDRAEQLSRSVGGGFGGVPVLLLGVLSAPNLAIAGASYLAGPGFAVGTGTHVSLFGTAHGVLPAFPVLAAVPTGAPNPAVWGVAAAAPLIGGILAARLAVRADGAMRRFGSAAAAAAVAGVLMMLLGWQGGGAVGTARLHTVGASPWQLGGAIAGQVLVVSFLTLGAATLWRSVRDRGDSFDDGFLGADEEDAPFFTTVRFPRLLRVASDPGAQRDADDDAGRRDDLAG